MKWIVCIIVLLSLLKRDEKTDQSFTGSTPAANEVRAFLGISASDSIDFIRWTLRLYNNSYDLNCQYGIGKPNTNGFINGGKKIELKGTFKKEGNYYRFSNNDKSLSLAELNENLLHIAGKNDQLLVGNGGWSYTLNNLSPKLNNKLYLHPKPGVISDSIVFTGRTPCGVPGVKEPGSECYKLKWLVVFYPDAQRSNSGRYKVLGTGWRKEGGRKGPWNIINKPDGRIVYELTDEKGKDFLHLLKLDNNLIIFTDKEGNLLVGDLDFSYTLNKIK